MSRCMICLNDWLEQGPHRVVSLKCGHIFGRDCIFKWLSKESVCPICKEPSVREDIRMLYLESQTTNKMVKNLKKLAKGRLQTVQNQLAEEKRRRIQAERELFSLRKSVVNVLRGQKPQDSLKSLLDSFQFHHMTKSNLEMKFFDFDSTASKIIYGKSYFVSLETNVGNFTICDIRTVNNKTVLLCKETTLVVSDRDSPILDLEILGTCLFESDNRIHVGCRNGEVHSFDKDWKFLDKIIFPLKGPIQSVVATKLYALVAAGLEGVIKHENGSFEKLWDAPCYSISYDPFSRLTLVVIDKKDSIDYNVFTDLDQIEVISLVKPVIYGKSLMETVGLVETNDRMFQIVSLVDYGNFIDIDDEIPMYTVDFTQILSVFDNTILFYDLKSRQIENTLTFPTKVECMRIHQDTNGTHLGVLTTNEYYLYKLN
jgi:hypothetical protein